MQSLARNPLPNQRNPLPKKRNPLPKKRNPRNAPPTVVLTVVGGGFFRQWISLIRQWISCQ